MSTGDVDRSTAGVHAVDAAVRFVAAQPDGVARLRALHKQRPDGLACVQCGNPWPCSIAVIAERAAGRGE